MHDKKIKVLQLQSRYNVNASDLAEQIVRALPDSRYEVTSAYLRGRPAEGGMQTVAAKVKYFDFSKDKVKGMRLGALKEVESFCTQEGFDVVIAHRFKPIHMLMKINHKLKFKLCVGVAHGIGDYDRLYRKLECRYYIRDNWKMVGVSEPVKGYLIAAKAGFTEQNVLTINNAIDIEKAVAGFLPKELTREQLNLPSDAFIFGTIGRLVPVKGHIYLLKAFKQLSDVHANAHLAIIGGGRCEPELRQYIADNNLETRVHLLGEIENAFRFIKAFDVFVIPSLSEGLPLALLEGMSASLPVIGSDISTIKPIIESVGQVFAVKDETSLLRAMNNYYSLTADELVTLGVKHFKHVSKNHSIVDYRNNYLSLIEQGTGGFKR